jgi:hypothetical protein
MFLAANSTFWPSSRTPSTTRSTIGGLPVEPDPHHGAIQDQADDRFLGE